MATSLAIGTFVQGAQVKLFERLSEKEWLDVAEDKSIGIWSMGLGALRDVDVHQHIKWKFVGNSSYRSASGAELARPNMRLDSEHVLSTLVKSSKPKRPALAFADEREVRTAMLERIRQCSNVEVIFGAGCAITGVERDRVLHADGSATAASLVVVADGKTSPLREIFFPLMEPDNVLIHRGYTVFRGHSPALPDLGNDAFQSWGPGRRFAVVPAPGEQGKQDEQGELGELDGRQAWFAAVSDHLLPEGYDKYDSDTDADGDACGDTSTSTRTIQDHHDHIGILKHLFSGWHGEVGEVLSSAIGRVHCEPAYAARAVVPSGLSHVPSSDVPRAHVSNIGMPVAFVGDAAHTFDPILVRIIIRTTSNLASYSTATNAHRPLHH
jgi:2-polyprenyl-6-methoxyphenol hydroxylase-like FAD-dependent oxidoreductase